MEDIPSGFDAKVRAFCEEMPGRVDQFARAARQQRDPHRAPARRRDARPADAARPRRHRPAAARLRHPLGPAQGVARTAPTSDFDFKIPVGTVGDNYDRYRCRLEEMRESVKIIAQALDGLPEGPYITEDRKYALPPRHELATSMEALIHHFKLVTEGFRVAARRVLLPDRVAARRARLLRALRRLEQAGARAHARPELREPAGAPARCARTSTSRTSSPRWRCSTRCSGASTDEPVRSGPPLRARLARPRLGRGGRPLEGPRGRPRSGDDARPGGAARADRGLHVALPGPALGVDPGAACRPEAPRLALAHRGRAGRRRHAAHPGLPDRRRDLLRHVRAPPRGPEHDLRLHEHLVLAARRGRRLRRDARRRRRGHPLQRALVRVPGRLRHRADGLGELDLRRPARGRRLRHPDRAAARRRGTAPGQAARQAPDRLDLLEDA